MGWKSPLSPRVLEPLCAFSYAKTMREQKQACGMTETGAQYQLSR